MTGEQSFLRQTLSLTGHFVRRSRGSSPDIFKIRQTCPACPANFGKPVITCLCNYGRVVKSISEIFQIFPNQVLVFYRQLQENAMIFF